MAIEQTGIFSKEQFFSRLPSEERRKKGPYAIAECIQCIPCNPCTTSCPVKAISQIDIQALPEVHTEQCTGCGQCVSVCPGLACFVLDESKSPNRVEITLPYEFLPVPQKGMQVEGLGRDGKPVTMAEVKRVRTNAKMQGTYLITIAVDAAFLYDVRSIRVKLSEGGVV